MQDNQLPDSRFGVAEAFWAPEDAVELGVGWERILFYWKEIQPEGPDDWNTLHVREEWLVDAEANGREVVGLLKNTAIWASEDGTEAGLPIGLDLPVEDPANYWANYTRRIAQYYSPRNVHNWIIWNEPEITADTYGYEFAGSVEDYYRLLKVAYQVIKEVDPEATIHLAGVTWWHDQTFLRRLFDIAAADPEADENGWFFDVISLHIYFRPDSVYSIVQQVQELQQEYGLDKSIWLNETNAPPNRDPLWPVDRPSFQVDLDQQAWFIIQATALALSAGTERVAVYKLADVMLPEGGESFGLVRQDSSRRPAFMAYAATIDNIEHFSEVTLKQHPHYYVATFARPDHVTRIAWARTKQGVVLEMPALADSATLVNFLGNSADVTATDGVYVIALLPAVCHEECLIGGAPVFIVEESAGEDIRQIETAVAIAGVQPTPFTYASATPYPTSTATATITPTSSPSPAPSRTSDDPLLLVETKVEPTTAFPDEGAAEIRLTTEKTDYVETPEPSEDSSDLDENEFNDEGLEKYLGLLLLAVAFILLVLLTAHALKRRTR
ncbi:MAG: hypothetical protein WA996_11775 [Candidatus Promineifilaceae bacterium]